MASDDDLKAAYNVAVAAGGVNPLLKTSTALKLAPWVMPLKAQVALWGAKKMGLFSSLGKLAGKGLKIAKGIGTKVAPGGGLVNKAIGVGTKLAKRVGRKNLKKIAAGGAAALGVGGVAATRRGGGGGGGGVMMAPDGSLVSTGRSYRRINPGNSKALRRAIRRVEAGARLFGKIYSFKRGNIRGAHGVKVKKLSIRRAS